MVVLLFVCAGLLLSSLVWERVLRRLYRGEPVLKESPTEMAPLLAMVLLPAGLLIGESVYRSALSLWGTDAGGEAAALTPDRVRLQCVMQGAVTIGLWILVGFSRRLTAVPGVATTKLSRRDVVILGLAGFTASLLPVTAIQQLRVWLLPPDDQHPLLQLLAGDESASAAVWVLCMAVICAPLYEELLYRVILQDVLRRWCSPAMTVVGSALVFSFVHGWPDLLGLFPLALILGYLHERTRSYLAVVIAHACFNGAQLLLLFLMR